MKVLGLILMEAYVRLALLRQKMVLMSPLFLVQNGRGSGNDERRVEGATKPGRRQLLGDAGDWRVP
jgi:hypothetical protein